MKKPLILRILVNKIKHSMNIDVVEAVKINPFF